MTHKVYGMTFLIVLALAILAPAQTFTTLYSFTGSTDGSGPSAAVIQDPAGNLYGTTPFGGDLNCNPPYGCGVVFKVKTTGTETVLHSFSGPDGFQPNTPLVRDSAGNLYGTASGGGSTRAYGTVFKIDTAGNATVLYKFAGGSDGCNPLQGLVMDKAKNFYGSTNSCGTYKHGTIFKINSAGNFTLLHTFTGSRSDGAEPFYGHLTIDRYGCLYGVTDKGGANGSGALYKLRKSGTFRVLHSFMGGTVDGCGPLGTVVEDKTENFYGTTEACGANNYGTIWKVSKTGKEIILHNFAQGSSNSCQPFGGVARDSKGNLYGVASQCGTYSYGALYELRVNGRFSLLHSFDNADGDLPSGEVLWTTKGALFGTTSAGGSSNCNGFGCGTVWSYMP